jgi:hypothetical protein
MLTRSPKHWFAVGFTVIAVLFSEYYSFFVKPPKVLVQDDGVAKWEERMKPVRENLPRSVREVGYFSDNDPVAMVEEFSLTRYVLAPIVVRQSLNLEWIIGNSTQPGFQSILGEKIPSGFTIKKLGAGIYLIHRTLP